MFERILVGLDGSEAGAAAAALAGWLARHLASEVRLVSVVEEPPPYVSARGEERSERSAAEAYYAGVHREAATRLQRRGVRAESWIESGNEASGLLASAEEWDADLVAIGHAGHSGVWGTGLGATAGRVAMGARSSVLVAQRGAAEVARLIVAYDGSPDAIRAVELAAAIAASAALGLTVAASPELMDEGDPRCSLPALRRRVGPGLPWHAAAVTGDPTSAIRALADDDVRTLIVLGAHGARHPWAAGLGPVALGVLERASANTLIVRPPVGALTARRLMRARPVTVSPDTPVGEAADLLLRLGAKCLPVVDPANRPIGILTLGDLLRRAAFGLRPSLAAAFGDRELERELQRLADSGATCRDIMTGSVVTAAPDAPVTDLLRLMDGHRIKRILVVEPDGALVGIVARSDILRAYAGAAESPDVSTRRVVTGRVVGDVMRTGIATVSTATPAEEVARAVLGSGSGRVAVVDAHGRLVGVVASRDLLPLATDETRHHLVAALGGVSGRLEAFLADLRHAHETRPTAGDLMRPDVVTIAPTAPLGEVLRLMMSRTLKRVLVVDGHGAVLGVVDRADVVRALADASGRDPGATRGDG